jgi:hypothetical protein
VETTKRVRGEDIRDLAASLRLLAAHTRAAQLDRKLPLTRRGREALRDIQPNGSMMQRELRRYGIDFDPSDLPTPSYETRERVSKQLFTKGFGPLFEDVAGVLDTFAALHDRIASRDSGGLRLVQQFDCNALWIQIEILTLGVAILCASGVGLPACVAALVQIALLRTIARNVGC